MNEKAKRIKKIHAEKGNFFKTNNIAVSNDIDMTECARAMFNCFNDHEKPKNLIFI